MDKIKKIDELSKLIEKIIEASADCYSLNNEFARESIKKLVLLKFKLVRKYTEELTK